ncbi:MAG: hypothetical protein ACI9EZ_001840 [Halobacteriales archaeon]|jgi:hypothetical protein
MSDLKEFLAGDRPDDVALYLSNGFVDDVEQLADYGESVDDGVIIIVDGESGRNAFQRATGNDAMAFAKRAMGTEGTVRPDLSGGECPAVAEDETPADHETTFVFAFSEEQNEEVGGLYAEGDVLHAYAQCNCGTAYTQKWVAGKR